MKTQYSLEVDETPQAFIKSLIKIHGNQKAMAMIDGADIVDADGNPVDITAIDLKTSGDAEETPADPPAEEPVSDASMRRITAAVQKAMKDLPKSKGDIRVHVTGGDFRNDDKDKHGFKSFGDFGFAVHQACSPSTKQLDQRLLKAVTGMSQSVGSDGGFAVPPEFSQVIWDGMNVAADNLMNRTDSYTVTGESLTFLANAETSRATGSRWGGIQGYWISEAAQITKSKPTLRQVKIEPQQLAVLVPATDKLLKNAPAIEQFLSRAAVDEITFMVGDSIINGDGAGKPLGVLNASGTLSIAKETGQAATTIVKENIDKMWAGCHSQARANAVWFINQDVEPQLEQLSAVVGTGGVPVYLPPGGITESPNARLKGRPVVPIDFCATLGTVGDIILADLSAYVTGTAGTIDSAMSMHLRFDFAESVFRFMFAVDGQPWLASTLTAFKGTNKLAPIVTLDTRS